MGPAAAPGALDAGVHRDSLSNTFNGDMNAFSICLCLDLGGHIRFRRIQYDRTQVLGIFFSVLGYLNTEDLAGARGFGGHDCDKADRPGPHHGYSIPLKKFALPDGMNSHGKGLDQCPGLA